MEVLTLGEKIKKRRIELNLTLKDLAGDKVTPGQISLIESSKSNPSMDLLLYISEVMDIPINYLMESERIQAKKICKYYRSMIEINLTHNDLVKAKEYIDKSSFYIDEYNLNISRAKNIYLMGLYEIKKGNIEKAFEYMFDCNLIYIKNNYLADSVKSLVGIAKNFTDEKYFTVAINYFHKSEALFTTGEITDEFLLGQIYYNLAVLYRKSKDQEKSKRYLILAKEKFESLEDKIAYSKKLTSMAEEFELRGKLDEAKKYSDMALNLVNDHLEEIENIEIEYNLGILYFDLKEYDKALIYFTKVQPFFKRKLKGELIDLEIKRAFSYAEIGEKDLSFRLIKDIDKIMIEEDLTNGIKLFKLKYYVNKKFENNKEAYNNLLLALNIARYKKLDKEEYDILMIISNHFVNIKKLDYAYTYFSKAMEKKEMLKGVHKGCKFYL